MGIVAILALIVVGMVLLLLEFFVISGTIVPGIMGIALMLGGVMLSYNTYGMAIGNYTLIGTLLFVFISVYKLLKSKTWDRVALKSSIDSKVNKIEESVQAGDIGITLSRLAPMGKVQVNNMVYEAKTESDFIDPKEKIEVLKVERNKLVVKRKID